MSTDRSSYPRRQRGLDHDWFVHQPTHARPPLRWPSGKSIALWITVPVEFFPMDAPAEPVRPLGGLDRGYPDFWSYSNRDYGNRIGIYRIMRTLDGAGLRATAVVHAAAATRYPRIISEMLARDWEIAGGGIDMGHVHHGKLTLDQERALIGQARDILGRESGQAITGWHSPGHSESPSTLTLLAEQDFAYVMDWANDDLPYIMTTPAGRLCAMPLTYEWSDRLLLVQHSRTAEEYEHQVLQAFDRLRGDAESQGGGRVLSLSLTPWVLGYPHRIAMLERLLRKITEHGAVWNATGKEIVAAFLSQTVAQA